MGSNEGLQIHNPKRVCDWKEYLVLLIVPQHVKFKRLNLERPMIDIKFIKSWWFQLERFVRNYYNQVSPNLVHRLCTSHSGCCSHWGQDFEKSTGCIRYSSGNNVFWCKNVWVQKCTGSNPGLPAPLLKGLPWVSKTSKFRCPKIYVNFGDLLTGIYVNFC